MGDAKERLPRLLAEARNDGTAGHLRGPRNDGSRKGGPPPNVIARRDGFRPDVAISVSQCPLTPTTSLRGACILGDEAISGTQGVLGTQSEIALAQKTSLAMTKLLGDAKERLPRLLAEARNDGRGREEARNDK